MATKKKAAGAAAGSTMVSGCHVQNGPSSVAPMSEAAANAAVAVASAISANARAAEALANALRGPTQHYYGHGINIVGGA